MPLEHVVDTERDQSALLLVTGSSPVGGGLPRGSPGSWCLHASCGAGTERRPRALKAGFAAPPASVGWVFLYTFLSTLWLSFSQERQDKCLLLSFIYPYSE